MKETAHCPGSTLREACSWGKVSVVHEQMVFSEVTLAMPMIVGYAYGKGAWRNRQAREFSRLFAESSEAVSA